MRALLVVVTLASACGRIGIDPLADARVQALVPDAAPVSCDVDGSACDDGNVCSTTSTCSGGRCLPAAETPPSCIVARSDTEYATTQGEGGWYYGFYNLTTDTDATYDPRADFEAAALFSGDLWRPPSWQDMPSPSFTWAYLAPWGGHPASYPERRAAIRRWVSDVSGAATAIVHAAKSDTTGGDGVKIVLLVDGATRLARLVEGTDGAGFTEALALDLVPGTTVDLLLDPNGTDGVDTTTMSLQITSR